MKTKIMIKYNEVKGNKISDKLKSFKTIRGAIDYARYIKANKLCIGTPELITKDIKYSE